MKKLMTVVSVTATLLAFGAVNGSDLTYTGFENAPYVAGAQLSTTNDDAGKVDGESGFAATWAPVELDEGEAVVTAYETTPTIAGVDLGNNFLKLDTNNKQVSRYAQTQSDLTDIAPVDIGDGLYIDTVVQFSAVEVPVDENGYPTNGVPSVGDGDKICIWLMMPEDGNSSTGTVVVTAGYVEDEEGAVIVATNYTTRTTIENNSWHRLQVKALSTIDEDGYLAAGFVIYVDGNAVVAKEGAFNTGVEALYVLTARANEYATANKLFPSLVDVSGANPNAITSISFQGSGAIDNVSFTQGNDPNPIVIPVALEPVVASEADRTYTGYEITGVDYPSGAYGYEFADESNIETEVGNYTAIARLLPGYAWTGENDEPDFGDKEIAWSIVAGGEPGADWADTSDAEAMADIVGKTAQQAYGITGAIGAADATQLTVWATGVGNVAFSAASSINTDCFLLNIANNSSAADIEAAKAAFKVAIEWDTTLSDWKITTLPVSKTYNGTLTIKGSTDLTVPLVNWDEKAAGDKFFYATLGL